MTDSTSLLSRLKTLVLSLIVFFFPLFFLPFTQEFFSTGKLYFVAFGSLLLLLISTGEFIVSKKLAWQKRHLTVWLFFFYHCLPFSTHCISNKVQQL
jgi:hypothetical protein